MKFSILILLIINTFMYAKTNIVVSILPQKTFVEKIGGDKVNVTSMVRPGSDPHTYEPKASQMKEISKADLYFPIGLEFEEAWLDKFKDQNKKMRFVKMTTGINYLKMAAHSHHEEGGEAAFEWAGLFTLKKGTYTWSFSKIDAKYADEKMKMLILNTKEANADGIEGIEEEAISILKKDKFIAKKDLDTLTPSKNLYNITFNQNKEMTKVTITIKQDGNYVFFTEHMPFEFEKDEHFFKNLAHNDIEPIASEPEAGDHHHHHDGNSNDPHVWTSPFQVKIMAKNIYTVLSKNDPKNKKYFKKNYLKFLQEISNTDIEISKILADLDAGSKFMVFHPSWGYFSNDYSLTQMVIEVEGKNPKPKALQKIIDEARAENIKVIFAQKEFSDKSARVIADELNIKVLKETPLAANWSENLIKMAKAIADAK